ncbi:MAG: CRISPR-associated endonuclease Cas2 [bacterium]
MHIIVAYDFRESVKYHKLLKKYLFWKQNSVFVGEISNVNFRKLQENIKKIVKEDDSVLIFSNLISDFKITKYGIDKGFDDIFI